VKPLRRLVCFLRRAHDPVEKTNHFARSVVTRTKCRRCGALLEIRTRSGQYPVPTV
jgi:hypothetical protein